MDKNLLFNLINTQQHVTITVLNKAQSGMYNAFDKHLTTLISFCTSSNDTFDSKTCSACYLLLVTNSFDLYFLSLCLWLSFWVFKFRWNVPGGKQYSQKFSFIFLLISRFRWILWLKLFLEFFFSFFLRLLQWKWHKLATFG